MMPLQLEINAFGPYAGHEILDFTCLADRRLFLICGPTGAGKTTILDAMCYALYGDTSGNLRKGAHMRSEYASPEQTAYVKFTFSVGMKRYRVERSPEQEIAKKRGTGLRRVSAAAALYEVNANGTDIAVIATKYVEQEVSRILGFKSEQFRQVVLLPQGDFRKLLLASSSDRQAIMQTLFHTQRYARFQELVKKRHDAIWETYGQMESRIMQYLQGLDAATEDELAAQIQRTREQKKAAETALIQKESERNTYQKVVQDAQALASHYVALRQSQEQEKRLHAQQDDMVRRQAYIALLEQAKLLAEPFQHIDAMQKQGTAVSKRYDEAKAAVQQAEIQVQKARREHRRIEGMQETQRQQLARLVQLQGMRQKAAAYSQLCGQVRMWEQEYDRQKNVWHQAQQEMLTCRRQIETYRMETNSYPQDLAAYEQAKSSQDALQERFAREQEIQNLARQIADTAEKRRQAQQKLAACEIKAKRDAVDYDAVQALFLQGQAAMLAAKLPDGQPCPVCGATVHPALAVPVAHMPQKEDVARRKAAANQSEASRRDAAIAAASWQTKWEEEQRQYESLRRQYPEDGDLSVWKQRLHDNQEMAAQKKLRVEHGKRAAAALQALQQKLPALEQQEQDARTRTEQQRLLLAKGTEKKRQAEADVPAMYRQAGRLEQDSAALEHAVQDYERQQRESQQQLRSAEAAAARWQEQAAGLQQQYEELRRQYADSMAVLRERVRQAGFADVTACRDMQHDIGRLDEERAVWEAYQKALAQAKGQIAREEAVIAGREEPDMTAYQEQLREKNEACRHLSEDQAQCHVRLDQMCRAQKQIADLRGQQRSLSDQYKAVGSLYELVSGKTTGVNFERYVLGALLDEVLTAANSRLDGMSRHRYALQRSLSWDDKRIRQIGLDIEVFDNYTGYARPANTLSGGETFLASLALALGLADVVQAYAGGIHLDAIFIDEGFGTLDSETLDFALKTLLELKQGGRLVGIISHVPELKERIDARLAVRKTERGSTAAFEFV